MEDKVLHQPTKDNGEGSAPLVHVKGDHGEIMLHYAPKLGDYR